MWSMVRCVSMCVYPPIQLSTSSFLFLLLLCKEEGKGEREHTKKNHSFAPARSLSPSAIRSCSIQIESLASKMCLFHAKATALSLLLLCSFGFVGLYTNKCSVIVLCLLYLCVYNDHRFARPSFLAIYIYTLILSPNGLTRSEYDDCGVCVSLRQRNCALFELNCSNM